jgi:hypothetical protein
VLSIGELIFKSINTSLTKKRKKVLLRQNEDPARDHKVITQSSAYTYRTTVKATDPDISK